MLWIDQLIDARFLNFESVFEIPKIKMTFISDNLIRRIKSDALFAKKPHMVIRANLERSMAQLINIYKTEGHKTFWAPIDQYALHGLITSYSLDAKEEANAFSDLELFESLRQEMDHARVEILSILERHLWEALTCIRRAEFAHHCSAIKEEARKSADGQSFCLSIIQKFRAPSSIVEKGGNLVDSFVAILWSRLKDMYSEREITMYLKRITTIEKEISQ